MLRYIELKTGHSDNGPAWIARVTVSKTGRTVYFNGKALKRSSRAGASANHYDLETGEEYWVSGIKKNGRDRHWAGSGKIHIETSAVGEYLKLLNNTGLDAARFEVVADLPVTDASRFVALENEPRAL